MNQKVHWSRNDKYTQSLLALDEATGLAWLHDRDGQIIPPSPDLTIQTGPVAIRKLIYQAAKRAGYNVKAY